MRVLQITTNYPTMSNPTFGIFMKEQVESLEQFGVINTIFFSNGSESNQYVKRGGMLKHMQSCFKLSLHLLFHKYDVIHCHSSISGLILFCSGGVFFNKSVLSLQNDIEYKTDFDHKIYKLLYPFFNTIIIKKKVNATNMRKFVYLPNGCNMDLFHPLDKNECKRKLNLCYDKRYVLFVDSNTSRKRTQKRKDRFDEVMDLLRIKYGYEDLEELIMIGVERIFVPLYINACSLHLLCSDFEGSPNSVKECISCNTPVVSTDVGNVREMIGDIEGCYVSNSFTTEELAKGVNDVLTKNETFNGREVFMKKGYDIDSIANKLKIIYDNLLSD